MHQTSKNSHMKICTWNSQGNPLNDAIKLNILNHLLTIEQCNVVMIQECGQFILPAQHSGRYHYVVVEHAGAYNQRCNTCIIADLNPGSSTAPAAIYRKIKKMPDINKNQRQKKLSCRAVLEFVSMLCVYDMVVSEKVKKHRINELKQLFDVRIREKKGFFQKNQLITSTFDFVYKVIKNLFG